MIPMKQYRKTMIKTLYSCNESAFFSFFFFFVWLFFVCLFFLFFFYLAYQYLCAYEKSRSSLLILFALRTHFLGLLFMKIVFDIHNVLFYFAFFFFFFFFFFFSLFFFFCFNFFYQFFTKKCGRAPCHIIQCASIIS